MSRRHHTAAALAVVVVIGGGCSGSTQTASEPTPASTRAAAIEAAVDRWSGAGSVAEAHAAAEEAANLVVGPAGPGYGDRDGDGEVVGRTDTGLLPGAEGNPPGLALTEFGEDDCADDVLGGAWDDPTARWGEMETAIAEWASDNNTFPGLAAHPMRVVGWASLTLAAESVDAAHEYAGHARIHAEVSTRAIAECRGIG